jgi:hypothetical protein
MHCIFNDVISTSQLYQFLYPMRHKTIRNIKTRIYNKRQLAILEFDNQEFVFLSPTNIKQNTSLEVFELELLIDSTLRIEFYTKGEKMLKGICEKDNLIVKEYFFELQKPVDKLRVENKHRQLPFKKIKELFYYNKFNRENVGIKTEDDKVIFISLKRFEFQSKLDKSEQHILVGSYICPVYYKTGETLNDGSIAKTDNVLRWINLRYSNNIEAMHESFENSIGYYDGEGYRESDNNGPDKYGYSSWDEMTLAVVFDGNGSLYWNID